MKWISLLLILCAVQAEAGVCRFGGHEPAVGNIGCGALNPVPLATDSLVRHTIKFGLCPFKIDSTATPTVRGRAFTDSVVTVGTCLCIISVYYTRTGLKDGQQVLITGCSKSIFGMAR